MIDVFQAGSPAVAAPAIRPRPATDDPWRALWALLVGFFMILVDATIVAVANPTVMAALHADYTGVLWVTSAYLLAYAVPLLPAGRLGDRYGPKTLYLIGLGVFTAASAWCGFAGSLGMLIAARVVQGVGAALLTPQTLSTITRIFPADRRGLAMSMWGATAGVATLVGPLAGGVLVDAFGWQSIFLVNVPIGIVGLVLAWRLVPQLGGATRAVDVPGVLLSGVGMFLLVFALQSGENHAWAWWIWVMALGGVAVLAAFVRWQAVQHGEPLVPLRLFGERDFSLSAVGVAVVAFSVTAMIVPLMFYAQAVCGLSPTGSALLVAPMAVASGVLAPVAGKLVDRAHPTPIVGSGFAVLAASMTWLSIEMTATTPIWRLVLPLIAMGAGMAFIWSPLATVATHRLPGPVTGAGSGVYNATRQVGGVLGSAGVAAFMTARIGAELPDGPADARAAGAESAAGALPSFLHAPFAAALSQTLLLPAFLALFGVVAALFLRGRTTGGSAGARRKVPATGSAIGPDAVPDEVESFTAALRNSVGRPARRRRVDVAPPGHFHDDDEYDEYTVDWSDEPAHETHAHEPPAHVQPVGAEPVPTRGVGEPAPDDALTEPLRLGHDAVAADTPQSPDVSETASALPPGPGRHALADVAPSWVAAEPARGRHAWAGD